MLGFLIYLLVIFIIFYAFIRLKVGKSKVELEVISLKEEVKRLKNNFEAAQDALRYVRSFKPSQEYLLKVAELSRENLELKAQIEALNVQMGSSAPSDAPLPRLFTQQELATIRYYLHPDKTQGKTADLTAKINSLIKESYRG